MKNIRKEVELFQIENIEYSTGTKEALSLKLIETIFACNPGQSFFVSNEQINNQKPNAIISNVALVNLSAITTTLSAGSVIATTAISINKNNNFSMFKKLTSGFNQMPEHSLFGPPVWNAFPRKSGSGWNWGEGMRRSELRGR